MNLRLSSARVLRFLIVAVGVLQLGLFAAAPAAASRPDGDNAGQAPAQLLYAARPAQVAILASKADGTAKPPPDPLSPVLAAVAAQPSVPPRLPRHCRAEDRPAPPRQSAPERPRVRSPPVA